MTIKKFPTPNLDEWFRGDTGSAKLMFDAACADIAIAVEAARVEVPEDIRETLEAALYHVGKCVNGCQGEVTTARRWLESLRPAPPAEPVEKRCGTCLHWNNKTMFGPRCEGPMPSVLSVDEADMMCGENEWEGCQVWEERKNV